MTSEMAIFLFKVFVIFAVAILIVVSQSRVEKKRISAENLPIFQINKNSGHFTPVVFKSSSFNVTMPLTANNEPETAQSDVLQWNDESVFIEEVEDLSSLTFEK